MNFLLFQLQRLLMLPIRLVTSLMELFSALSDGRERSSALVKGLPAAVIAVAGSLAVFFMSWGGQEGLTESYSGKLARTDVEQKVLQAELQQALIAQGALAENATGVVSGEDQEDPREAEIAALNEKSNIYLNKLIKIQPEQSEYKYRLATRALAEGNMRRCFQILKQISPIDTPGYPPAHLQLALLYENSPTKNANVRIANIDTALVHVEHCLTNDINNLDALKIKARLLMLKGSKKDARDTFKKVFEADAKYFHPLIQLQQSESERKSTLMSASNAFSTQLTSSEVQKDLARWVSAWQGYAQSMSILKQFPQLEQRLLRELDRYKDSSDNLARLPFLKKYLAQLYIAWTASENGDPLRSDLLAFTEETQKSMLEYYGKAFSYNENNRTVLQSISRLAFSPYDSIKEQSRQIYDPEKQTNLPPEVLNQMGLKALKDKDYGAAKRYYERARAAAPENPAILSNLAYAYLKSEDEGDFTQSEKLRRKKSNAERAYDLVAQAIRLLPEMSMYRHTLEKALMQLKNKLDGVEAEMKDQP